MIQRSVITQTGFTGPAPKVYGRSDWDKHPAFIGVEWALARAPDLSKYPVVASTPYGPLRSLKTRPLKGVAIVVFFYEDEHGNAILVDVTAELP